MKINLQTIHTQIPPSISEGATCKSRISDESTSQDAGIISLLKEHNISTTSENIRAVKLAKVGTSIQEANFLSKYIRENKGSDSSQLIMDILSETLTEQMIKIIQERQKVVRTQSFHENVNIIHHNTQGNHYTKNVHASYTGVTYEEYGYFVHPTMQVVLDKTIQGQTDDGLKAHIKDNIDNHFKTIVDDMSNYDFEVLVREAILGNDGHLSDHDFKSLSRLPYDYLNAQESYEKTIHNIKSIGSSLVNINTAKGISDILHDALLSESYSDYIKDHDYQTLRYIKKLSDQVERNDSPENIKALMEACQSLEVKPISKTRMINTVFKSPDGHSSNRPNAYTAKARHVFKLLHLSNIAIKFDGIERNRKTIISDLSSPGYSKKDLQMKRMCAKKILDRQLINQTSDKELLMHLLPSKDMQVLDISFIQLDETLSFGNFVLKLNFLYFNYGHGQFDIHVTDHRMNLKLTTDSPTLITYVKKRETSISKKINDMGFEGVTYTYNHMNHTVAYNSDDGSHQTVRTEHQVSTQTEVSL